MNYFITRTKKPKHSDSLDSPVTKTECPQITSNQKIVVKQSLLPLPPIPLSVVSNFNSKRPEPLQLNYLTAHSWFYPKEVEARSYQLEITRKCLFFNTLVILPTGLGKTLVASVTMFNFLRWFPKSRVAFLAPTRPLVLQQSFAYRKALGVSAESVAVMIGSQTAQKRQKIWMSSVQTFFATPHCFANDLERGVLDVQHFSCLIVDEAHRASTKAAPAEESEEEVSGNLYRIIFDRHFAVRNPAVRVIGLTATPGNSLGATAQIVRALRVSNLEARADDDPDVKQFVFEKSVEETVVEKDKDRRIEEAVLLLEGMLKSVCRRLRTNASFWVSDRDIPTVKRYALIAAMNNFREGKGANILRGNKTRYWSIMNDFTLGITLISLKNNLENYGATNALSYLEKNFEGNKVSKAKAILKTKPEFQRFKTLLNSYVESSQGTSQLSDGLIPTEKPSLSPKIATLVRILKAHYENRQNHSGTIIFTSLRVSAEDILQNIAAELPKLRCGKLIGQTTVSDSDKGLSQKDQQSLVADFRKGCFEVLVSTSIGEEGLDIGQVDLIVNFDSVGSFVRAIQRMGRTGRKREGKCVSLVTQEEKQFLEQRRNLYKRLQKAVKDVSKQSSEEKEGRSALEVKDALRDNGNFGRCFPVGFRPEIKMVELSIGEEPENEVVKKKTRKSKLSCKGFISASDLLAEESQTIQNLKNNEKEINSEVEVIETPIYSLPKQKETSEDEFDI